MAKYLSKGYLALDTPYRGLLVYHGLGTRGKPQPQ